MTNKQDGFSYYVVADLARDGGRKAEMAPNFGTAPHAFITARLRPRTARPAPHPSPTQVAPAPIELSSHNLHSLCPCLSPYLGQLARAGCPCSLPNRPEAFSTSFHNALPHVGCSCGLPRCVGLQHLCCCALCPLWQRFQGSIDLRCSPVSSPHSWIFEARSGRPQARHHRSRPLCF